MKLGNLIFRAGVRFDGDDYMDKNTIAPRFSSSYDLNNQLWCESLL
ncbi:hypothetical protein KDE12_06095 [Campylobacter sp. faydin G-105]|nr:hypothetical protein [Campylobacter anatolicus]MBR8462424.1 hypothetical protein [Campylobacter anatolicus]